MAETKRASETTMEEIEAVLRGMPWAEIHKARVWADYGDKIVLYADGEFSVQGQSTHYRDPDAAGVIAYLDSTPWGNSDSAVYFEGWVERVEDGVESRSEWVVWDDDLAVYRHARTGEELDGDRVVETETGRVLTVREAVEEAIEEGDWDYGEEIDAVLENAERERGVRRVS